MDGCKHGKVDQIVLKYTKTMFSFCQRPKSISKVLFKLDIRRSSKLIIESDAPNHMVEYDFECNFMTLNILKLEFFSYFLNSL
jgi:hypothetical protein